MNSQIILVSPASRCREAERTGLPLLRFGLGLDANGTLTRTLAQANNPSDLLCLSDFGVSSPISDSIVRQLTEESRHSGGIVADIERSNSALDAFLHTLDTACAEAKIPLFVPFPRSSCAPNAWAIAPGAASGGSLQEELERGMMIKNGRLAVTFEPTCRRFLLPSSDPNGEALSADELTSLRGKIGAHVFFSRELCTNYFTYMDGDAGVFVLFDTKETLRMRLELIQSIGIPYIFAAWEGCESLFSRS